MGAGENNDRTVYAWSDVSCHCGYEVCRGHQSLSHRLCSGWRCVRCRLSGQPCQKENGKVVHNGTIPRHLVFRCRGILRLQGVILFVIFGKIYGGGLRRHPAQGIIAEPAAMIPGVPNALFAADHRVGFRRCGIAAVGTAGLNIFAKQHGKSSWRIILRKESAYTTIPP